MTLNLVYEIIITLYNLDRFDEIRFDNQVIYITLRNNLEVQLLKLFIQRWLF